MVPTAISIDLGIVLLTSQRRLGIDELTLSKSIVHVSTRTWPISIIVTPIASDGTNFRHEVRIVIFLIFVIKKAVQVLFVLDVVVRIVHWLFLLLAPLVKVSLANWHLGQVLWNTFIAAVLLNIAFLHRTAVAGAVAHATPISIPYSGIS